MIATVTIGTVSMQGILIRRLPGGRARISAHGWIHEGRLVPTLRRIPILTLKLEA